MLNEEMKEISVETLSQRFLKILTVGAVTVEQKSGEKDTCSVNTSIKTGFCSQNRAGVNGVRDGHTRNF